MTGQNPVRTAVITGGTEGIGLAIAKALQATGVQVAVGSRRVADDGFSSAVSLQLESSALVLPLDVASSDSVSQFISVVRKQYGGIDILVNAAGVSLHQGIIGHTEQEWVSVLDINLNGCFRTIHACLPGMLENGWGRIVNIASTAAHTGHANHPAYCASKAGLLGLTRAVALEGAASGVNCVSVSPTWIETEMLRNSASLMAQQRGVDQSLVLEELAAANPQERLVQATEVASLVSFLCGDQAPALTMEDFQINAGALW